MLSVSQIPNVDDSIPSDLSDAEQIKLFNSFKDEIINSNFFKNYFHTTLSNDADAINEYLNSPEEHIFSADLTEIDQRTNDLRKTTAELKKQAKTNFKTLSDYIKEELKFEIFNQRRVMITNFITREKSIVTKEPAKEPDKKNVIKHYVYSTLIFILIIFVLTFILYAINVVLNIIIFLIFSKKKFPNEWTPSFWYIFAGPLGTYYFIYYYF